MAFHVRITLTNVHKDQARSVVGIGDTVFVDKEGKVNVLTAGIQKKYSDISYSLDDDEEPAPKKEEPRKAKEQPKKREEKKKTEKSNKRKDESEEYSDDEDEDYDGESGSEGS